VKLQQAVYARDDVVGISRELIGKVLCTRIRGALTSAVIIETEAYAGAGDRASHAYGGRRTKRTEPMFGPAGTAYVYLCYGIHHLFNVVTGAVGTPHAVLIRAGRPLAGEPLMRRRRGPVAAANGLLAGPGSMAKALGVRTRHSGVSLLGDLVWIEDQGHRIEEGAMTVGPRVGVDYAGPDARRPYRFRHPAEADVAYPRAGEIDKRRPQDLD
jgi:DNA-3-methyladenine glycosylase